ARPRSRRCWRSGCGRPGCPRPGCSLVLLAAATIRRPAYPSLICGFAKEYRAAMLDVRPVTTGAAHGSGRLALDAAARKLAGVPAEGREIEKSLAQEMTSAAVSQGGTGRATIGPRTAGPAGPGGGGGRRRSDTHLPRVTGLPQPGY